MEKSNAEIYIYVYIRVDEHRAATQAVFPTKPIARCSDSLGVLLSVFFRLLI